MTFSAEQFQQGPQSDISGLLAMLSNNRSGPQPINDGDGGLKGLQGTLQQLLAQQPQRQGQSSNSLKGLGGLLGKGAGGFFGGPVGAKIGGGLGSALGGLF